MDLIIETDLGHDPDDFFALCYLHSAGVNIRAILLTKGHAYQIEIARFFCDLVGLDIPIGSADISSTSKTSGVHFHKKLLDYYNYSNHKLADDLGSEVIKKVKAEYPTCQFFVCGPPKSLGRYLKENPEAEIDNLLVQGGFLSYAQYAPTVTLAKFEGKDTVPTFNLNGAKIETQTIIDHSGIKNLSFVSKNICHTVVYDRDRHVWMKDHPIIENKADELFMKGMDLYLQKHMEKKFHDPTAAVCLVHPEIATWFNGKLYNERGGWGTKSTTSGNSRIIADIDRDALWDHLKKRY